ncbi:MAG: hypothetical protein HY094_06995 [Candidatus Melainabacteria bacterium]|nr:hypothetical protein [Candidatus Melainabacteria bacterium]
MTTAIANTTSNGQIVLYSSQPSLGINDSTINNSPCDEDRFTASNENQDAEIRQVPWYRRLIGNIVDMARRGWRTIRRFNPFTQLFNLVESIRCTPHIENARNRNGISISNNEELRTGYHQPLMFDPEHPNESAIFRYHFSNTNESRPLVVLFLGNSQIHTTPGNIAGINELFERFQRAGHNVVVFRVGQASSELRHRFGLSDDCSLHTDVVYQHTINILDDIINCRGEFAHCQKPSRIVLGGYSMGGGFIRRYVAEHGGNIGVPITATASIDAVIPGSYDLGCPDQERPSHNGSHLNIYQDEDYAIRGAANHRPCNGDVSMYIPNETHEGIDNNQRVQDSFYRFLVAGMRAR